MDNGWSEGGEWVTTITPMAITESMGIPGIFITTITATPRLQAAAQGGRGGGGGAMPSDFEAHSSL